MSLSTSTQNNASSSEPASPPNSLLDLPALALDLLSEPKKRTRLPDAPPQPLRRLEPEQRSLLPKVPAQPQQPSKRRYDATLDNVNLAIPHKKKPRTSSKVSSIIDLTGDVAVHIIMNGDVANLPGNASFSYRHNIALQKLPPYPFTTTRFLQDFPKAKIYNELTTLDIVDKGGVVWRFKHPEAEKSQWDNLDWVNGLNTWLNNILVRCFGVNDKLFKGETTYEQWSTIEFITLKELVITFMRRKRARPDEGDWHAIAVKFNLAFRDTTRPKGSTLMLSGRQTTTVEQSWGRTKEARLLGERSGKSFVQLITRVEGKNITAWSNEYMREAETLGWLENDETCDGIKYVFKTEKDLGDGVFLVRYENTDGDEMKVTTDWNGNLIFEGMKIVVLEDDNGYHSESEEEDSDSDIEELKAKEKLTARQLSIDGEAARLLLDPIMFRKIKQKAQGRAKVEYNKVLAKVEQEKVSVSTQEQLQPRAREFSNEPRSVIQRFDHLNISDE